MPIPGRASEASTYHRSSVSIPTPGTPSAFQGGTDYAGQLIHLFGSRTVVTVQASVHHEQNRLTAADGVNSRDLTCLGGRRAKEPCDSPTRKSQQHLGGIRFDRR